MCHHRPWIAAVRALRALSVARATALVANTPWPLSVALVVTLSLALLLAPSARALQTDSIYVCVGADGHKTYQNSADGGACRRVEGITATVPAVQFPGKAGPRPLRADIAPASFPRVDPGTQRLRDGDRRRILEEELRAEEQRLEHLRTEFNHGQPQPAADEAAGSGRYRERVQRLFDDIERSEGNIASLRRELAPVRY